MENKFLKKSFVMLKGMKDENLSQLPNQRLLDYHRKSHMLYSGNMAHRPINKPFINSVVDLHNRIVKEMLKRGMKHNTPLKKV